MRDGNLHNTFFFLFFFFFHLTYSRWTSSLPSCLWSQRIFPSLPGSRLTFFYRDASSALLQVCFCLCSLFYRDDVLCWLLLARPFLYAFHAHLRFPVDLVWFRLSCDHGWIRSGSVNVRKQQQQQQQQQLVNQWLNFTYSRSHAFRYERKNTNPTLVRIELTTSVLADVQLTY